MTDAIDLLERIGRDANLRYAATDELALLLSRAGLSEACQAAVISADMSLLAGELGETATPIFHHSINPGHEEQQQEKREDEDQEEQHEPQPDQPRPASD